LPKQKRVNWFNAYIRKIHIWETDYGRHGGWIAERNGQAILLLNDPRFEEMFWDSYHMDIVTQDPKLHERLSTEEFWASTEADQLVWRSREFNEIAELAHPAGSQFPEPGRLMMRALYLGPPIRPWDWIVVYARKALGLARK
jgi:hypothetical protein